MSIRDTELSHLNSQRKLSFLVNDAIKEMQRFAQLPVTGIIDNATLNLINSPRCGEADIPRPSFENRNKRYVIYRKWPKLDLTWR